MLKNLVLIAVMTLGLMQPASAHKVNLFAYAEGQTVFVEGYFVDGRRAQNSRVQVFDTTGALLLEGVTDDEGLYKFETPVRAELRIVLNAGMGHQTEFVMSANELGSVSQPVAATHRDQGDQSASHDQAHEPPDQNATPIERQSQASVSTDHAALEEMVQHAVAEAIKPLVRELADARQQARITDIVAALGYLFGVLGLFAFYKARKQAA